MARNSEFFLGDEYVELIKLGSEHVQIYLGDTLVYQYRLDISTATVTCVSRTYTGNTLVANSIVVVHDGNTLIENVDYEVTTNAGGINVGTYTVVITGIGKYRETATGVFKITKAAPVYTAPTANNGTYTGSARNLLVAGTTNHGTIQYSSDNSSWSTTIPTGINATSYTSYWRLVGDSNHTDISSTSINTTISKANPTYTAPVNNNPTYTGSALNLMTSGSTAHGTIQYSSDNSSWSISIPTATNAGSYDRYWRLIGDSNHNDVSSTKVTCSIATATMTNVTNPTATSYTYSGSAQNLLNAGTATGGTWYYSSNNSSWSTSIPTGTNAGDYTSYAKLVSDSNHKGDIASFSIGTNIARHSISPTVSLSGWTYGTTANNPSVSGNSGSGSVTYYYKVNGSADSTYTTTKPSNAGSYVVKAEIVQTTNYLAGSATNTFSISKANLNASVSINNWTYGGTASTPSISGNSGSGSVTYYYKVSGADDSTYTTTKPTNAGSYIIRADIEATTNYNAATVTNTFSIAKANINASVNLTDWTYGATANSPSVSGNSGSGSVSYSYKVNGADDSTYSSTKPSNAGSYVVRAVISATSNYNGATVTNTFSIAKANINPTVSISNWTYGGTASTPSVNGNSGSGSVTYYYKVSGTADSNYSTTKPSNAGTYTIKAVIAETSNYNGATVTNDFTINKASLSASVSMSGWTYGGTANNPSVTGNSGNGSVTYTYKISGAADSTYSSTKPSNAGNYVVRAVIAETSNYNGATVTNTFSIAKASPSYTAPTKKTLTYNGSDQSLLNAGSTSHGTIQYSSDGSTWGSSIPTGKNATSYDIYWRLNGDSNHNSVSSTKITVTISKVTPTVTVPTAKVLTYNTSAQELVNAGSANFGTLKYSLDDSTWSTGIPTATNYGSYTVYYKVDGDSNVNNVASASVACSISEKKVTATVTLSPTSYTYSGNECKPTVTVKDGSITIPSSEYTVTYSNNKNAGTGTVTITDNVAGNYEVTGSATFTINRADLSASVSMSNWTYGNTASNPSVSGNSGGGSVTYTYKVKDAADSTYSSTKPSNAGTYTVKAVIAQTTNYNGATVTTNFTINKANLSASVSMNGWTYGGTATSPSVSGNSGSGSITYTYKVSGAADSTYTSTKPSNAGTYVVRAVITETSNYNGTTVTNTFTIAKAAGSVTINGVNLSYNGNSRNLATVSGATGTMHYGTTYGTWSTSIPTSTNAGSWTIYWYMDASTNYEGISASTSRYISSSIAKIDPTYVAPTAKSNLTYTGSAQTLYNAGTNTTAGSFAYTDGTRTNAGSQTVSWSFTPTDTTNYNTKSGSFTGSIAQATGSATVTGRTVNYNGNAQNMVAVSNNTGTMHYRVGTSGSWTTTIPTRTNAGSDTIYYYMDASTNYTARGSSSSPWSSVTGTVSKINPTYTAPTAKANLTYTGSSQNLYNAGSNTTPGSFSYTDGTRTNAGSQTVSWSFTPTDTTNYNSASGSFTGSIAQATGSATVSGRTVNYSGSAQNMVSVSGNTGTMHYRVGTSGSWTTTIPTRTNAGSDTIYYYMDASTNYTARGSSSSPWGSVTGTVSKIDPTYVAPTAKTGLTYSGSSQYLYNAGSNTTAGSFSYSNGTRTDAGSQTVSWSFTPTDTTNYNSKSGSFTGSIGQATGSATVSGRTVNYTGSAQNMVSVSGNTGTMHYRVGTSGSWTTTIPTRTNAGSDTIYYYMDASTNYTARGTSSSPWGNVTGTVSKINPTYTAPTAKTGLKYTGSSQYLYNAGSNTTAGSFSYSNGTRTAAGSQTVSWNFTPTDTTNYNSASGSFTGSIAKAAGSVSISGVNLSYNGSSRNLITVSGATGTMHYATTYGTWSTSIPTSTNAGSWTIYWYMDASDNYEAISASTSRYVSSSIAKIDPTYTAPTAKTGLSYNGSSQYLYNAGSNTTAGSFSYSNGTRTDAGSQTVSWSFTPTDTTNYNSKSGSFTGSIAQATGSASVSGRTVSYTGSAQNMVAVSNNTGTMHYRVGTSGSWTTTIPTRTTYGSDTIYYYMDASTNYTARGTSSSPWGSVTGTVNKAATNAPVLTAGTKATYDGSTVYATAKNGSGNPAGTIYYGASSGATTYSITAGSSAANLSSMGRKDVGTTTIYAFFRPTDTTNYSDSSVASTTASVTNKASQNAPTATGASVTYPSTATASASGGGGVGTLTWTNGSSRSAIGSQTTKAYWSGNSNYNASGYSSEVTLSVAKYTPTVTLSATDRAYNGNALYATATVSSPSGGKTIAGTIYYGTSSGATTYSVTYSSGVALSSVSVTNAGSTTVYAYFVPNSTCNDVYNNSGNASKTMTISKASQSAPTATGATVTYGSTATATASGGGGVGTLTWTNGNTRTAVGSQTTKAYWSGNTNYNASSYSNEVTLTVNKANGYLTATTTNRTYTGSAQTIATIATNSGTYYFGFGTSTTSGPSSWGSANTALSATYPGTYYVWAKCDTSTNYNAVAAKYIGTVTFSKASTNAPVLTAGTKATYDGTAVYATAKNGSGNPAGTIYYGTSSGATTYNITASSTATNLSSMGRTNVGTTTIYAFFRPTDTANYADSSVASTTASVTNKANQSAPTAVGATTTYGTTATATASGGGGAGSIEWSNGSTRTTAGSQTTKARWSGNSNYNASAWSNEVTLTVNKANPSYTAPTAKTGLVYNGSSQTLYNAGSNTTAGSFAYTNGTRTSAGSQTVSWSFTPTDTTNYNSASGSFSVSISQATGSISFSTKPSTVSLGSTVATAISKTGDGTVSYSSSNTNVATIDSSGVVTGVNEGTSVITVTLSSGTNYTGASANYTITCNIGYGVYILYTDGKFSAYNTLSSGKTPVGVAVKNENINLVLHPDSWTKSWGYTSMISGVSAYESGYTDYNGYNNTTAYITAYPRDNSSFKAAKDATYADGRTGYLGASGEMFNIAWNDTNVNTALNLIGGTQLGNEYWTSTQCSDDAQYAFGISNKYPSGLYKAGSRQVRSVAAL